MDSRTYEDQEYWNKLRRSRDYYSHENVVTDGNNGEAEFDSKIFETTAGKVVADVGCGIGEFTLKIAQIEAFRDPAKRFYIAKRLVEAKAHRTVDVLTWLAERYGKFSPQADLKPELERLHDCASLPRLLSIEGRIADYYWRYLQKALPGKLGFTSRMHESHQMNASDPVNALLNYDYAILESECRKALNSVGMEPTIGFLTLWFGRHGCEYQSRKGIFL